MYKLKVYAHVKPSIGTYSIRVLPKYNEEGSAWDIASFEPNNSEPNAYFIAPGSDNAITAQVEEHNSIYATAFGDSDWYRFEATAGKTYIVDLLNVSASFGQKTPSLYKCADELGSYKGLALIAYNTTNNSLL